MLHSEDVNVTNDVPIFATSNSVVRHRGSYGMIDKTENQMMSVQWKKATRRKCPLVPNVFLHLFFQTSPNLNNNNNKKKTI